MKRVALITGSSRGIGRAIASELAGEGWAVCINYLTRRDAAESLLEELRGRGCMAIACQADVADRAQVAAMVRRAERELGPVRLLVNNAGISFQGLFQDTEDSAWARMLDVNLTGCRNAAVEVLPGMLREKAGCIVNISSMWGLRGASCEVAYACTKAALVGLTRSLALELAPRHPGARRGAGLYRTGHGPRPGGGDPCQASGGAPHRPPGPAGGHRPRRGLPGLRQGRIHYRPGPHRRRRLHRVRREREFLPFPPFAYKAVDNGGPFR